MADYEVIGSLTCGATPSFEGFPDVDDTPVGEIPAFEFTMPLVDVNPDALELYYGGSTPAPPPPIVHCRVLVKVGDETLYSEEATVTVDENGITLDGKDWRRL